ncbi:MAG: glycosyltransferase [Bacteroides sp.]|nr:glycosyltransferase [Roseburia sp.]MCM1345478.1 glycosyltransferase [Bacteroides sp.]MCM1419988.1 glycosyltransferase [Bacteroides sp.]
MKNFAIFCITYNSYSELKKYLESIDRSASCAKDFFVVDVFIIDNTDKNYENISCYETCFSNIRCQVFPYHENLGYFGGAQRALKEVDIDGYDYIAITNVDLILTQDVLVNIATANVEDNIGWIAPSLLSTQEKRDKNPARIQRYSKRTLQLLLLKYTCPILDCIYTKTLYKRKRLRKTFSSMDIYAGHGSFILLTKEYFRKCGLINYPVFLYGEELYLAEECRKHSLRVLYLPSVVIYDSEHVSTSKLKRSISFKQTFYYKCNYQAIRYILAKYY